MITFLNQLNATNILIITKESAFSKILKILVDNINSIYICY